MLRFVVAVLYILLSCDAGAQATMPTSGNTGFWNSAFGSQRGGSRVATYTETLAPDSFGNGKSATVVKLMSISAMPVYINKSHEELRHEDYLLGDKGSVALKKSPHFSVLIEFTKLDVSYHNFQVE